MVTQSRQRPLPSVCFLKPESLFWLSFTCTLKSSPRSSQPWKKKCLLKNCPRFNLAFSLEKDTYIWEIAEENVSQSWHTFKLTYFPAATPEESFGRLFCRPISHVPPESHKVVHSLAAPADTLLYPKPRNISLVFTLSPWFSPMYRDRAGWCWGTTLKTGQFNTLLLLLIHTHTFLSYTFLPCPNVCPFFVQSPINRPCIACTCPFLSVSGAP